MTLIVPSDSVEESSRQSEMTIAQQTEGSTIATERPEGPQREAPSMMIRVELTPGYDASK